jgi:hypothetical protein
MNDLELRAEECAAKRKVSSGTKMWRTDECYVDRENFFLSGVCFIDLHTGNIQNVQMGAIALG